MNDYRAEVGKYPAGIGSAFAVVRDDAVVFHCFIDTLPDGFDMALGISIADNKIVREGTDFSYIQRNDICCLLLRGSFGN